MTLKTLRQSRWTWRTIGLLQIGNAAAFGAVVLYGDFSKEARGTSVATAPDEEASTAATPVDETSVEPAPPTTFDGPMPAFSVEPTSPVAEPSIPVSPAIPSDYVPEVSPSEITAPTLINPATNTATVRFIVNGERVELKPGERRTLSGGDSWLVRFHRGGKFGAAMEPIYNGQHQFVIGPQGWRLERADDAPN
jgi:hypothetical protein